MLNVPDMTLDQMTYVKRSDDLQLHGHFDSKLSLVLLLVKICFVRRTAHILWHETLHLLVPDVIFGVC